jgi:hypothetical protein
MHKECQEKENAASTPACCNCQLAEGGKPHPPNYRSCRHAKEGTAEEEIAENTQNYNGESVIVQPHPTRCLLCGGAPRQ